MVVALQRTVLKACHGGIEMTLWTEEECDSHNQAKKHQLIKRFMHAEAEVRKTEARYREYVRGNNLTPMRQMAYEAMMDATHLLEKAFEEMLHTTGLCTAKLGDLPD